MQSGYVMDYTSAFGRGRLAGNICCLHHPTRAKLCKTECKTFELRASRSVRDVDDVRKRQMLCVVSINRALFSRIYCHLMGEQNRNTSIGWSV